MTLDDRYRELFTLSHDAIFLIATDGSLVDVNPAGLTMLRCSADQARAMQIVDTYVPEERSDFEARRLRVNAGVPVRFERTFLRADGTRVPVEVSVVPVSAGGVAQCVVRDITAQRAVEEAEARLQQTIDQIPVQAWCTDANGVAQYQNQRWLDYTGLDPATSAGWGWRDAVHPDDLPGYLETWKTIIATGQPVDTEVRMRRFDGVYRWFLLRCAPARDAMGVIVNWYGTNTDIEDRRAITDAIPHLIVVLGPDGRPLHANATMLDYTGLTMAEALARADRDEQREGLASGKPFELEEQMLGKDGRQRWFLKKYHPLFDTGGQLVRWYVTGTDIDGRKQAEDRTRTENLALREDIDRSSMFEEIVGSSAPLRRVLSQVALVAPVDSTVLILGETGTGKELVARAIHKRSGRAARAFIRVNCAAIPSALIASELFGHEKGAFTGAVQRRLGRFEAANGGTIFLDEIGDLPAEAQVALLRVLQEREIERVGSQQPIPIDVRVLAATHHDLDAAVAAGTFREDLYYRINVFPVRLPPLRERRDDIPLLVEYLIARYATKAGKRIRHVERRTLDAFRAYDWPGNVRELQNVIERAVILTDGDTFAVDDTWLRRAPVVAPGPTVPFAGAIVQREREMIEAALSASRGRVSGPAGAAVKLGIPRQTLESKIAALGIDKHRFKAPR